MTDNKIKENTRQYLNSFNYFRGIAILFIVVGHCFYNLQWQPETLHGKLVVNLILGGTAFFVFISGVLFHHIFYKNFEYKDFMNKKIKRVVSPYILFSIIPIFYFVFIRHGGPFEEYFFLPEKGIFFEYIRPVLLYFLTGRTFSPYWYIPFIMVVFALSPVFIKYIRLSAAKRMLILIPLFIVAAVIHRPVENIAVLQSVFYFVPVYLLGIIASIHKEEIYRYCRGREIYLLIAALALSLTQVIFYDNYENFHKNAFEITVIDINIIQKSVLCLFFMVLLSRFEDSKCLLLSKFADASFAVYFLHPLVFIILKKLLMPFYVKPFDLAIDIFYIPMVLSLCLLIATMIKKRTGKYSRYIIGW